MTRAEMRRLGWEELDVLLVTGDAYVDHPTFGAAILGRWLVQHGYRVGIVAQPAWDLSEGAENEVGRLGRPRLFAGATSGALDSLLAHYTAFRKKRSEDAYSPGGLAGKRPNRASIVYANLIRRAFPGLPVVLGGIEASLRRAAHYDFWTDKLRRSLLLDSKADAILYGMAETGILRLAQLLDAGEDFYGAIRQTPGAVFFEKSDQPLEAERVTLPSFEAIEANPRLLLEATRQLELQTHQSLRYAAQASGGRTVLLAPPGPGLDESELDLLYGLPFTRAAHPGYKERIPAVDMIAASLTTHRGCAGGCSFCALALHQGRRVRSRSKASILAEAERLTRSAWFTGSLTDVGGPSANMWGAACLAEPEQCARPSCLTPEICPQFSVDQDAYVALLRSLRKLPGVKHARVASGWRMDLALRSPAALKILIREFVGGQVKVAPEHKAERVLRRMRKPPFKIFEAFLEAFERESGQAGKEQYVIPYLMSAFPGCTDEDMQDLSEWLQKRNWRPQQVQCFIPLPGTMASAYFFAGVDQKGNTLYVARTDAERLRQHGMLVPLTPHSQRPSQGQREPGERDKRRDKERGKERDKPAGKQAGKDADRSERGGKRSEQDQGRERKGREDQGRKGQGRRGDQEERGARGDKQGASKAPAKPKSRGSDPSSSGPSKPKSGQPSRPGRPGQDKTRRDSGAGKSPSKGGAPKKPAPKAGQKSGSKAGPRSSK